MTTDRELLEKAAKAVGVALDGESPYGGFWLWDEGRMRHDSWNPLTDDGDALRLAVKLNIDIIFQRPSGVVARAPSVTSGYVSNVDCGPEAATRRAIVRAAAAIGETK